MMKKRVLLAEDDPDTRFLLSLVVAEQGYDAVVEKPVELDGFVRTVRTLCPPGAERRVAEAPHGVNRRHTV
jgi:hypothetical protein